MSTWKQNGVMSGTSGRAKRLEAICINLTGEMAVHYDVYYRVHAQTYGWLGWSKMERQRELRVWQNGWKEFRLCLFRRMAQHRL